MKHLSIIAITILSLFTSCSRNGGEKSVFDYIPGDTETVVRANIDHILKNSGCQIRNGNVQLSPSMEYLLENLSPDRQELITSLVELYPHFDMTDVIITDYRSYPAGIARVPDPEKLEEYLEAHGVATEIGKHTVYVTNAVAIALNDSIAILAQTPEIIAAQCDEAQKSPLSADHPAVDFLSEPDHTILALNRSASGSQETTPGGSRQLRVDIHERLLEAEMELFDSSGSPISIDGYVSPIAPDVLSAIPANAQGVIAIGDAPELNTLLESIDLSSSNLFPSSDELMFISDLISGSFMVSATPASTSAYLRRLSPPAWNFTGSMIQDNHKADKLQSTLTMLVIGSGKHGLTEEEGQKRLKITPEISLYIKQDSSLLTLSSDLIRPDGRRSEFADILNGASFGLCLNVPFNSETMKAFNLPYGPNLIIKAKGTSVAMRLSLNGSSTSVLEALAQTLQAIR